MEAGVAVPVHRPEIIMEFCSEPIVGVMVQVVAIQLPRLPAADTQDRVFCRHSRALVFDPSAAASKP